MTLPYVQMRRWAPAIALLAAAAGCTSLPSAREDWRGHQISELVARRGPANRISLYPYGGTLYIWETPDSGFRAPSASIADDADDIVVHREIALVSDAGIILRTQVTTEHSRR